MLYKSDTWSPYCNKERGPYGEIIQFLKLGLHDDSLNYATKMLKHFRSVSMRDMGTEMTPIPSQDPSMASTPVGATTPLRSPNSVPSTPRRGVPNTTPVGIDESRNPKELTEQEAKLRMRKEIFQLGVQLGKMKEDMEKVAEDETDILAEEALRVEFEKRAVAWEDA
ncbi:hypothetical protein L2E82_25173 [Cichorium intybus]|uniref:Uncharacterized protein n=1 Tax=Cichorium intybus TaxID=13427 RepID=A0ACB9E2A9_CICIN|nr:hypothetical protein L2E82_25173 [Cichorium intybus]